jgi:hypothetical protein
MKGPAAFMVVLYASASSNGCPARAPTDFQSLFHTSPKTEKLGELATKRYTTTTLHAAAAAATCNNNTEKIAAAKASLSNTDELLL